MSSEPDEQRKSQPEARVSAVPDTEKTTPRTAEDEIISVRREKAAKVRARGENPFANDLAKHGPVNPVAAVREHAAPARREGRYPTEEVDKLPKATFHVCGRVIALRSTGGLSFLRRLCRPRRPFARRSWTL